MKTQIRTSLVAALMIFSLSSIAQEKRYVETIVSDTVMLKPVGFVYQISAGNTVTGYETYVPQDNSDDLKSATLPEIEDLIKKARFSYVMSDKNDYSIMKGTQNEPSIMVTLNSKNELDKLYKLLSSYKGISGQIFSVDYESPALYYDIMFKRLYEKALSEATVLAKISGNEIDKMVSATEVTDQFGGYMDMLTEISKYSSYDNFGLNSTSYKTYTRKFSFRFDLK